MGLCGCSSAASAAEARARTQLQRLALAAARREREAADLRLQDDARRLGCLTVARAGPIGASPRYLLYPWLGQQLHSAMLMPLEFPRLVLRTPAC